MKRLLIWIVILAGVIAAFVIGGPKVLAYLKERNKPVFRTSKVRRGDIQSSVEASGTIQPVLKVQIGSFVSGPITDIYADFNQSVEEGELLAKVDPRLYRAAVQRDEAALARAKADVRRVQATLNQAINDEKRARRLLDINEGYLSQSEMDQLRFNREALEAQLEVAELQIQQAKAQLENSDLNLGYTEIKAPNAGIVIDRKIDPGQTLAAQFQTPELFVLAPDMDQRMWVHANVVEADVGHILKAQSEERPVKFYVDAYEGELFSGVIRQVRQNPTTDQNVVTYPVVVETPNPDMKLLPGMTANLSFLIDDRKDALLIPSAALRYLPAAEYSREEDRKLIEGDEDAANNEDFEPSAEARVQAHRNRRKRHVWVQEGDLLKAVEIEFGISDGQYYELVKGDLTENQELITGVENRPAGR